METQPRAIRANPTNAMNPGNQKLKTPIQQYIDKLEATAKWASTDDQKQFFKLAADHARDMLQEERAHIEWAWRDGQSGIKHQSGAQYYRANYENNN